MVYANQDSSHQYLCALGACAPERDLVGVFGFVILVDYGVSIALRACLPGVRAVPLHPSLSPRGCPRRRPHPSSASDSPRAFPKRHLYLDLLWNAGEDEEEGIGYRFSFRRETDPGQREDAVGNGSECWFRASDVLSMDGGPAMVRWPNKRLDQRFVDHAYETLDRLHRVVRKDHVVAYYEERRQTLDSVSQRSRSIRTGISRSTPPFSWNRRARCSP